MNLGPGTPHRWDRLKKQDSETVLEMLVGLIAAQATHRVDEVGLEVFLEPCTVK